MKIKGHRSRNITNQIQNLSEIQQKQGNSRSKIPNQEEQNLDLHVTILNLLGGGSSMSNGAFTEKKVDETLDGEVDVSKEKSGAEVGAFVMGGVSASNNNTGTFVTGRESDVNRSDAAIGASAKGEEEPRTKPHGVAESTSGGKLADGKGVITSVGRHLQRGGFRRAAPIVAKPPPLLAAIFPWDVDSCDRIEKVAVMGVGFQGSDGGGRSILDVGGRLKLIGDDPWKLDGGGPCSVIISSCNNTQRKKEEQHLGMMEKTMVYTFWTWACRMAHDT